jgi:hypothetical protein
MIDGVVTPLARGNLPAIDSENRHDLAPVESRLGWRGCFAGGPRPFQAAAAEAFFVCTLAHGAFAEVIPLA